MRCKPMAKACSSCPAVVLTGIARPLALTAPGSRPSERSAASTASIWPVDGPNSCANCATVK
jgi:hypothetical protein